MNYPHRARRRFGQNFLVDRDIIQQIVSVIAPRPEDRLVEIGPGRGALTKLLLSVNPNLTALEIDRDLIALLQRAFPDLNIQEADALQFDFARFAESASRHQKLRIIGNLPYNISTPLLFHLLDYRDSIEDMHFMLQKEVVDRLGAVPGQKAYGRLSIMIQYFCQVMPLFEVPPDAFQPAPKVISAVVRIKPYQKIPYSACNPLNLSKLVNLCFQQRRKTLRNCLKPLLKDRKLVQSVDLNLRPEQLTIDQYAALCNELYPYDATD